MSEKDRQLEQWLTGINDGILQPNKSENNHHCDCGELYLAKMEIQRLNGLVANMMSAADEIEEFVYDK